VKKYMRISIFGEAEEGGKMNSTAGVALATIFTVIGVAVAGYGFTQYQGQGESIDSVVNISATVAETDVRTDSSRRGGVDYQAEIMFKYSYEGGNYSSNYIYPLDSDKEFNSESKAKQYLENYPQGKTVKAFVNPEKPGEAFLNAERSSQTLLLIVIGGLMAVLGSVKTVQRMV